MTTTQTFHDFAGKPDTGGAFQFNVASATQLAISLWGLTGDADIYVFSGGRQRIGQSLTHGLSDEFLELTTEPGIYMAAVAPHLKADSYHSITITVDGTPVVPVPGRVTPLSIWGIHDRLGVECGEPIRSVDSGLHRGRSDCGCRRYRRAIGSS